MFCPGFCNAAWRKAEAEKTEKGVPHELIPVLGQPRWCDPCSRSVESALLALPTDAALVYLEIKNGTPRVSERVSGTRDRPLHPKDGLARLIDEIHETLTVWEDDVRETRLYTPRKQRQQAAQIGVSARFLVRHTGWILTSHPSPEATKEFGREITAVHRKAQKATHNTDPAPRRCVGVRCPGCGWKALVWEMDREHRQTGYVLCEHCNKLLTEREYRVEVLASSVRVMVR